MTEVARAEARAGTAAWTGERLDELEASFAAAGDASGSVSLDRYSIAGGSVALRFASPALRERLTPAFEHLAVPSHGSSKPGLTVYLWESASTGADPPPLPQVPDDHAPGALYHLHRPPLRAAYQPGLEALSILDVEAGTAWHWVADAHDLPYWDQASPIRQILFWWLESRDCLQVHGGAVGTEAGGVLLVGKAGSGKSTVALSSLGSDLLYAGDDYVAVMPDPSPWVYSLYNSGKLEPHHVRGRLQDLLPLLSNASRLDTEKAVVYVRQHFPERTTFGFPLRAILVPKIRASQAEHRIVQASPAAAFAALAPSTIFQLHTAGPRTLAAMSRLVGRVSCYEFELGTDISSISEAITDFLRHLPFD